MMRLVVLLCRVFMMAIFLSPAWAVTTVDMNAADAAQLDALLDGVGAKKAQLLVEWRQAHGPFRSVDDVAKVKGFGVALAQRNKDKMVFGARVAAPSAHNYADKSDKHTLIVPLR